MFCSSLSLVMEYTVCCSLFPSKIDHDIVDGSNFTMTYLSNLFLYPFSSRKSLVSFTNVFFLFSFHTRSNRNIWSLEGDRFLVKKKFHANGNHTNVFQQTLAMTVGMECEYSSASCFILCLSCYDFDLVHSSTSSQLFMPLLADGLHKLGHTLRS